jgi:hypothetical protein
MYYSYYYYYYHFYDYVITITTDTQKRWGSHVLRVLSNIGKNKTKVEDACPYGALKN